MSSRLIVIIGGGTVAARKAAGLIEAGAGRVRCVAAHFRAEFPPVVERVAERYDPRHLDGAGLVFAATDSAEVNDAVVRDARARGVLVSRADAGQGDTVDGSAGDFTTPALLRRAAVTVSVSAGSPALAAVIRDGLAARWDERWSRMAEAMRELRPALIHLGESAQGRRADVFRALASEPALDAVAAGGVEGLCDWLAGRYPEWGSLKAEVMRGAGALPRPSGAGTTEQCPK